MVWWFCFNLVATEFLYYFKVRTILPAFWHVEQMSRHLFNLVVISTILFQLPISLFESVIDIVDGAVSSYYLTL